MKKKSVYRILILIIIILSIPLIAMQFTNEVNWSLFDFIVAGGLLFLLGMGIEIVLAKAKNLNRRILFILLIVFVFLVIWVELAVGLFGTPFAGS